jgi:hypothetical protein
MAAGSWHRATPVWQQWDLSSGAALAPLMPGGGGKYFAFVKAGRIFSASGDTVRVSSLSISARKLVSVWQV